MTDDTRQMEIGLILGELEALWRAYPDQRLGQLVVNLGRTDHGVARDVWNVSDTRMLEKIRDWLSREEE